jgi:hypothetical protein
MIDGIRSPLEQFRFPAGEGPRQREALAAVVAREDHDSKLFVRRLSSSL